MEPLGVAAHDNDVVLFCKLWMADDALSQRPLVVMPEAGATRGEPPLHMARASITPKLANHLLKYSARLAEPPYKLEAGSKYISDWVHRRLPVEPPRDVTGVFELVPIEGGAVVAVHPEPEIRDHVATVALADVVVEEPEEAPSARAVVVYGVAANLHVQHGIPWPDAFAAVELAFHGGERHTAPAAGKPKHRKLLGLGGDDGLAPVLDIQPLDLLPRG